MTAEPIADTRVRGRVMTSPRLPFPLALLLCAAAACAPGFQLKNYQGDNSRLFNASLRELQKKHWDTAVEGFERLTLDLPARDTLLPRAYFFLGKAHGGRGENLLAAQSYSRLTESFPDDSLADDALEEAGRAYARMWRKPVLDATYGQTAISTYQTLLALYPNSVLRAEAERSIAHLQEMLAEKEYENGMFYFRRKAFDSAIIYFKSLVATYPTAAKVRDAELRMVEAYRNPSMRYTAEANETCDALRLKFASDNEVRRLCGAPAPAAATTPPPATTGPPAAIPSPAR
jgi:outer membrane assembly lipoprotein YfiO